MISASTRRPSPMVPVETANVNLTRRGLQAQQTAYDAAGSRMNARPRLGSPNTAARERLRRSEGRHNARVKQVRRAFSRGQLTAAGDCAIEGVRVIEEAIRSGL